jgi:hypothetical protein
MEIPHGIVAWRRGASMILAEGYWHGDDHLSMEIVNGLTTAASIRAVAAVGLAVGDRMFVAAVVATILALALLVLVRPVKQRLFPNRKEARRVTLILRQDASPAESRSEVDGNDVHLERLGLALLRPLLIWKLASRSVVLCGTPKERRVSINRTQALVLGFFALTWTSLVAIFAAAS